jgi:hypothetical protein
MNFSAPAVKSPELLMAFRTSSSEGAEPDDAETEGDDPEGEEAPEQPSTLNTNMPTSNHSDKTFILFFIVPSLSFYVPKNSCGELVFKNRGDGQ